MSTASLAEVRKPEVYYELVTLRDAMTRWGLYQQLIYRWVEEGRLHPVRPGKRTLYPAWELDELTRGRHKSSTPYTYAGQAA